MAEIMYQKISLLAIAEMINIRQRPIEPAEARKVNNPPNRAKPIRISAMTTVA
jgi:hypothetical protein